TIVVALHVHFALSRGAVSLVPKGFSGPGVSAVNAVVLDANPRVMIQNAVGAEILDRAEFIGDAHKKTKNLIHIFSHIRERVAHDQDPTLNRGREEELSLGQFRKSFA